MHRAQKSSGLPTWGFDRQALEVRVMAYPRVPSIQIISTLGPKDYKYDPHRATWSLYTVMAAWVPAHLLTDAHGEPRTREPWNALSAKFRQARKYHQNASAFSTPCRSSRRKEYHQMTLTR